jgi:hypothetical protein
MLTGKQAICRKYLIRPEFNCISTCHSLELDMNHGLARGRIQGETLSGNRSQETSRRSFVISPSGTASGILGTEMPRSKRADKARRAPRVKLAGTILALLRLDNGREVRARLHQLSFTGGLLHLEKPLDEGIKLEVMFHIGESTIRSKAVMLFPMWATQGFSSPSNSPTLRKPTGRSWSVICKSCLDRVRTVRPPLCVPLQPARNSESVRLSRATFDKIAVPSDRLIPWHSKAQHTSTPPAF